MANTYSKVYCQTVFAVKYRKAMIHDELKKQLFPVMGNLINEAGAQVIVVNGVEDHVHCLFRIFPKNSISEIMKIAKGKRLKKSLKVGPCLQHSGTCLMLSSWLRSARHPAALPQPQPQPMNWLDRVESCLQH